MQLPAYPSIVKFMVILHEMHENSVHELHPVEKVMLHNEHYPDKLRK